MVVRWVEVLFLRDGVAGQILELLVILVGSYLAESWVFWCVVGRSFCFCFGICLAGNLVSGGRRWWLFGH